MIICLFLIGQSQSLIINNQIFTKQVIWTDFNFHLSYVYFRSYNSYKASSKNNLRIKCTTFFRNRSYNYGYCIKFQWFVEWQVIVRIKLNFHVIFTVIIFFTTIYCFDFLFNSIPNICVFFQQCFVFISKIIKKQVFIFFSSIYQLA